MDFWWISIDVVLNQNTSQKIGFQYYKLTQYITYKATLAGIKVIQVSEFTFTENAIRKVYKRYNDCLPVLNAVKRMLIEMLLSILPIGL